MCPAALLPPLVALLATVQTSSGRAVESPSSELRSGIIYGPEGAFSVEAPSGWVLDNASGQAMGLPTVCRRESETTEFTAIMYGRVLRREVGETDEHIIESDLAGFRAESSAVQVSNFGTLRTGHGRALVKQIHMAGQSELVAYISEPVGIVLLVLATKTEADLTEARPAFESFVGSYFWVGAVQFE